MTRKGLLVATGAGLAWLLTRKATPPKPNVAIGSLFYASRVYDSETQEIRYRIYNRGATEVSVSSTVLLNNVYQSHISFARTAPERSILADQFFAETVRFNPADYDILSWPRGTYRIRIEIFLKGNRTPVATDESVGTIEVV